MAVLLRPGGTTIVELDPPDTRTSEQRVRFEASGAAGPWFHWASVAADRIEALADDAQLAVAEQWSHSGRWFASLVGRAR